MIPRLIAHSLTACLKENAYLTRVFATRKASQKAEGLHHAGRDSGGRISFRPLRRHGKRVILKRANASRCLPLEYGASNYTSSLSPIPTVVLILERVTVREAGADRRSGSVPNTMFAFVRDRASPRSVAPGGREVLATAPSVEVSVPESVRSLTCRQVLIRGIRFPLRIGPGENPWPSSASVAVFLAESIRPPRFGTRCCGASTASATCRRTAGNIRDFTTSIRKNRVTYATPKVALSTVSTSSTPSSSATSLPKPSALIRNSGCCWRSLTKRSRMPVCGEIRRMARALPSSSARSCTTIFVFSRPANSAMRLTHMWPWEPVSHRCLTAYPTISI